MVNFRGRPAGGSDARARILAAAERRFLAEGYRGATVRGIARDAGVDHALVNYHFGRKPDLLAAVLRFRMRPDAIAAELVERDSMRADDVLRAVIDAWESGEGPGRFRDVLVDAIEAGEGADLLAEYVADSVLARFRERLRGPRLEDRLAAGATVLGGLVFTRYLLRVEPIASLPRERVVAALAPLLAAALRGGSRP